MISFFSPVYLIDWFHGNFIVANPSHYPRVSIFPWTFLSLLLDLFLFNLSKLTICLSLIQLCFQTRDTLEKTTKNEKRKNVRKIGSFRQWMLYILFHVRILFNVFNVSSSNIDKYVEKLMLMDHSLLFKVLCPNIITFSWVHSSSHDKESYRQICISSVQLLLQVKV